MKENYCISAIIICFVPHKVTRKKKLLKMWSHIKIKKTYWNETVGKKKNLKRRTVEMLCRYKNITRVISVCLHGVSVGECTLPSSLEELPDDCGLDEFAVRQLGGEWRSSAMLGLAGGRRERTCVRRRPHSPPSSLPPSAAVLLPDSPPTPVPPQLPRREGVLCRGARFTEGQGKKSLQNHFYWYFTKIAHVLSR